MLWLILSTIGDAPQSSSISLSNASEFLDILGGLKGKIDRGIAVNTEANFIFVRC